MRCFTGRWGTANRLFMKEPDLALSARVLKVILLWRALVRSAGCLLSGRLSLVINIYDSAQIE